MYARELAFPSLHIRHTVAPERLAPLLRCTCRQARMAEQFFRGGGEAGDLLARLDWTGRAGGSPDRWPQSLRTSLSICLASRYPICILWGPEHLYLYNDAYTPMLGDKHPAALAARYPEVWPEIWESDIRPLLEPVLATGVASWADNLLLVLHRHGYPEECYFSFSFAPIRDESDEVGGVFTAITETTAQVVGQRRLQTLSALGARTAEAKSAGEACAAAAQVLGENRHDLPFALLYLLDGSGEAAHRAACVGLPDDHPAAPPVMRLAGADDRSPFVWPLARALAGDPVLLTGLSDLPCGPWPEPTTAATILPLVRAGQRRPHGFLVSGMSPRRPHDVDYRDFLFLVAGQVGTALGNAVTYEEERRRAEALAELDRAKTVFFSNVSHEFRTPLTLMLGPLEDMLASDREPLSPGHRERLETVQRNGERLLKLVNTLLDFARIEAGRAEASYEPTDLATLTAALAGHFRSAMERAGIELRLDCRPLAEPVYVDREMWEKVVLNLLSNAFKFTLQGHVQVTVRPAPDRRVELIVEDTGTGIPAHEVPRLFERFHRVQGARGRTHEGTGIGLALIKELVALHGGSVSAESEVDHGTRFTVSLPLGRAHLPQDRIGSSRALASVAIRAGAFVDEALRWLPDAPGAGPAAAAADGSASTPLRARLLLADDNADMRDYLRGVLEARWEVEAVADGAQALEAARRRRPDLVLTDVMMPHLDGFGLVRELRRDAATASIPIIVLSARAGEEARIEGISAGVEEYLVKPFSARELLARVETQLVRARLRAAEEEHHRRLGVVFQHAPVGIALLRGPDHVFELANPDYLALVSHRPVLGRSVRHALPELAGQGIFELLDGVQRTGQPHVGRSTRVMLADAEGDAPRERYFDFVYQPMPPDERGPSIAVVAFDVTALAVARRDAEAANRSKDEFMAMLGHELRNPLAPITTALHLLKLRGGKDGEKERAILERQVKHLARLVDDLLDVSRIARGKVALTLERTELAEVVGKAIEVASPLLEQKAHRLTLQVAAQGLPVQADRARLAQVLANLLINAAKYTEAGGHIELVGRVEGEHVVLTIRDDGMGIAPDMLPRVFDLFFQQPQGADRSYGGLGLGLAIARSFTSLHGGSLSAHSDGLGRGATFELRLPTAAPASPGCAAGAAAPESPSTADTGALRVLVVDDNVDAATALADALCAAGHVVRLAEDGPGALGQVEGFVPDVALLDLGLPVMDGFELAQALRQRPGLERLPLVAVTGYGRERDQQQARAAGFDAHVMKPYDVARLDALIRGLAGRHADPAPGAIPA